MRLTTQTQDPKMTAAELLESALKLFKKRGFYESQALVLLVLARNDHSMRLCDLADEIGQHRQTVWRAVESFANDEVRVSRLDRVTSIVHLQASGLELLKEILNTTKVSS